MAVSHKGAISLGLLYIPVGLYTTTRNNDLRFNQLCKDTKERVRYKKYCPSCNKEVKTHDIIKGYEYETDKYVVMTQDEMENLLVLYPTNEGMIAKTLFYQDEIVALPKQTPKVDLSDAEIAMAKTLLDSLTKPFDASTYKDEYQERLRDAIMQKIRGEDIVAVDTSEPSNVIDLMEALQRTIEMSENQKKAGTA